MPECSSATVEIEAAMRMSFGQLLERGHTRIGVLRGFNGYRPGEERLRGYRRALEDTGIEPKEN
ncbi:MAG: substrate-binding domain-containing protein, partial [Candidatus Hydrogenedentes bacterium]|nr:substrate-binding domain-containing protein [Candidatus Hydrogenedentota bacterium]